MLIHIHCKSQKNTTMYLYNKAMLTCTCDQQTDTRTLHYPFVYRRKSSFEDSFRNHPMSRTRKLKVSINRR